jgi:hypothetical protein
MEVSGLLNAPPDFIPGERAYGIHWIGGWMGLSVGLDVVEKKKILHCRKSNPGRPARSSSLVALLAEVFFLFLLLGL